MVLESDVTSELLFFYRVFCIARQEFPYHIYSESDGAFGITIISFSFSLSFSCNTVGMAS